ncbi:MAG: protein-methionine-sulfoxide reductase catalytic subunit MsrP [Pseudomonadales bacterium]
MKKNWQLPESAVTDQAVYLNRRRFIQGLGVAGLLSAAPLNAASAEQAPRALARPQSKPPYTARAPQWLRGKLAGTVPSRYTTDEDLTPYPYVSQYNNFYEFGTGKEDPFENAQDFRTDPWSVSVSGECEGAGVYTLEDILKPHDLEERIYRLRCVEAWSMVVPWIGFPLADLLKRFKPTSKARFVRFKTLLDPEQMPGQASRFTAIDYPYVEGLRIDEAMNELSFMAVGLYGEVMPPQNGAPLRLVVPWKYGFKSIKSIVSIEFLDSQPKTTWEISNPREYGFYANVNPSVSHPRWSQASERRLPSSLFSLNRIDTRMFNGYEEQVAAMYQGMNLRKQF